MQISGNQVIFKWNSSLWMKCLKFKVLYQNYSNKNLFDGRSVKLIVQVSERKLRLLVPLTLTVVTLKSPNFI